MDIDLLAKMVKEAILDHDAVTLPGVGCFVAELVPSSFSDKGYTINPPYRRLYFSPKQGTDTYLADLYARDNQGVDAGMANRILTEFLSEMKEILKVKKTVVFPGLGRLRATRENHFFFVADEDLDIYPEGLGLAPLSLKTHVETPEEVATAVAGLAELIAEPVFRKFDKVLLHQTNLISIAQTEINKVLGDGIPAKSFAAGANPIGNGVAGNINYQGTPRQNGWPRSDGNWQHSDIKKVAYFYLFDFFNTLTGRSP